MSASLVGSEMCIRDRWNPTCCARDTLSDTRAPRWPGNNSHWSDLATRADTRDPRRAHPRGTD
eukprot:7221599-Alexandrium_andersonii.AAC.1